MELEGARVDAEGGDDVAEGQLGAPGVAEEEEDGELEGGGAYAVLGLLFVEFELCFGEVVHVNELFVYGIAAGVEGLEMPEDLVDFGGKLE